MSDVQADQTEENTQTEQPAGEQVQESKAPDTSWVPKRISEITAARRAAEARAAELEAEVARLRASATSTPADPAAPAPSNQSVEELAKAYAARMVREQTEQQSVSSRVAEIESAGVKEFGDDFNKSVQNLQLAGVGGPEFLKVLTNVPGAEKVITWMGKDANISEAMRIASLDPVQMGIELMKLTPRASKDLAKQISKAPAPITPVDGSGGGDDGAMPDPTNTKAWQEWRNKTARRKR